MIYRIIFLFLTHLYIIHSAIRRFNTQPSQAIILYLSIGGISVKLAMITFQQRSETADRVNAKLLIINARWAIKFFLIALNKAMPVNAIHKTASKTKAILLLIPPLA